MHCLTVQKMNDKYSAHNAQNNVDTKLKSHQMKVCFPFIAQEILWDQSTFYPMISESKFKIIFSNCEVYPLH